MSSDVFWLLVGAAIGAAGAIVGGFVQGLASDWFERRRAAAEKHEQWIQTALEWAVNGCKDSLRRANLHDADLRRVDLGRGPNGDKGADLSYSNLRRARLWSADLRDADLSYADLRDTSLFSADLRYANLFCANLRGADLRFAKLGSARLWYADLRDADLELAHLEGADLTDAKLQGAKLTNTYLMGAELMDADLTGADLTGAQYNPDTTLWPDGFTPPPEAIQVEDESHVSEYTP